MKAYGRFPGYHRYPKPVLGPCRCDHCGEPLFWAKRQTRALGIPVWRFGWREDDGKLHFCPNFDRLPAKRTAA